MARFLKSGVGDKVAEESIIICGDTLISSKLLDKSRKTRTQKQLDTCSRFGTQHQFQLWCIHILAGMVAVSLTQCVNVSIDIH